MDKVHQGAAFSEQNELFIKYQVRGTGRTEWFSWYKCEFVMTAIKLM